VVDVLVLVVSACFGLAVLVAVMASVLPSSPARRRDGLRALALLVRAKQSPQRHRTVEASSDINREV
jgi:hypothetical protein